MNNKKIALIYPLDTSIPLQSTSYRVYMPRYGILAIAKHLIDLGYEVRSYCEQSGSEVDWDYVRNADFVCYSVLSFSALKAYDYIKHVKKINPIAIQILGGSHASLAADDCLNHIDFAIRNEGEEVLSELLDCLSTGKDYSEIRGLSLNWNGVKKHNKARDFIKSVDFVISPDLILNYKKRSIFSYISDIFKTGVPRFNMVVSQASRGCPFDCKFCFVKIELGKKYRTKTPDLVLEEIEAGVNQLSTKYIMFVDNDFCINKAHSLQILKLLEEKYAGDLDIFLFTRLNIAFDNELVEAFKRAGRVCIALGIESIEEQTQKEYRKEFDQDNITKALAILNENNIKYHALFVVGADSDNEETIQKILKFSVENNAFYMGMQILYDFPEKEKITGHEQCIANERFIHADWRFYSGTFVIHYPLNMKPSVLQKSVLNAHLSFYRKSKFFSQFYPTMGIMRSYIKYLEKMEKDLYTNDDKLILSKLPTYVSYEKLEREINIKFNTFDYLLELVRFYRMNILRKDAWLYLLSLIFYTPKRILTNFKMKSKGFV